MIERRRVWVAFTLLSATFFILLVDFSIVSIALPSMEHELHLSASQGQWIVSTYAIFLAGFLMLTGRCADSTDGAGSSSAASSSLRSGRCSAVLPLRRDAHRDARPARPWRSPRQSGGARGCALALSTRPATVAGRRDVGHAGTTGIAAGMLFGGVLVQFLDGARCSS